MRVAAMNRIKRFEVDASGCKALSKHSLFSLLGEKSLAFDPLRIVAGDVRLKTVLADQETGGVVHVSSVSTTPTTIHTPPQIDRCKSKNRKAWVVGKRGWRVFTAFIIHRLLHVFQQKKGGSQPEPGEPKPDKSKTGKSDREGDKGLQRVKRPKKEGPSSSILRQGFYNLVIFLGRLVWRLSLLFG